MTLVWQPNYTTTFADPDVQAYLTAVEAADGQPLEYEVAIAINSFVLGCKLDGLWSAIKASCILAGAKTLNGALVPLVGTAPTNVNFVAGDYNRKTGLAGDGSTKYLDSNRNNNADPQDSKHISIYCSDASTIAGYGRLISAGDSTAGDTYIVTNATINLGYIVAVNTSTATTLSVASSTPGFLSLSRSFSSFFNFRMGGVVGSSSTTSTTPRSENITLYRGLNDSLYANPRIAFYSIGESLDLAALDRRVTALIDDIGAAIP